MHDDIKRFPLDGEIGDANVVEEKARLVAFVESQMRDDGYIPALDMEPQFTRSYKPDTETYAFVLSVYGIYVGKAKAWDVAGMMGGKIITKYIPPVRSKQS